MKRASSQTRNLAKQLILYDLGRDKSGRKADFRVCEKLRPQLATLVGSEAFRALVAHALALASVEVPALIAIHVKADGTMEVSEEIHAKIDSDVFFEGRVVVVAHLLELLVAFIGENLTLQLIRQSWPKVPFTSLDLKNGDKNETKK